MRAFICAATPERAAVLAQAYPGYDPLTISSLAATAGLSVDPGDIVVVDGYVQGKPHPIFWDIPDWPYILQTIRTLMASAGNGWMPRFA